MRRLQWISGLAWLFCWRIVYLEVFRWHHLTPTLRFNPPPPLPGTDLVPTPGLPVRAVRAGALVAPVVFVAATAALRRRAQSHRSPPRRHTYP